MSKDVVLVAGTKKGLFLLRSDSSRASFNVSEPMLKGMEINHATVDHRNGRLFATANDAWFGTRVTFSDDMGQSWQDSNGPKFADGADKAVERLWRIEPGADSEPDTLYCGVDPATLFRSSDGGSSWSEIESLTNHETRSRWNPGAGGLIAHSISLDPQNAQRLWVAISAAGVFRSDDAGASWQPKNVGLKNIMAKYDPQAEMYPIAGQCVHHLVRAAGSGDRLYAQSHWGTYITNDGAETWSEITQGLPSDFGMAIAAHPRDPDVAYVMPLEGAEFRGPPEGKLRVYRTSDAGKSWQPLTNGLPQEGAFMGMYREAMCVDALEPAGIYLGTNTGQIYASSDEGESWQCLTSDLPPVSSLHAYVAG